MKIFFDLDGTLLDSRQRIYQLFTDLTSQQLMNFDEYWQYKRQMISNEWLLENKLGYNAVQIVDYQQKWFPAIESEHYLKMDSLFAPVPALLMHLAAQGFTLFIVTARQSERLAKAQIENLGIAPYITQLFVTGKDRHKHELLSELQVTQTDLFFGDTGIDIQTAKLIGATSIAVLTGFRDKDVLLTYQPDKVIANVWDYFGYNLEY